MYTEREFYSHFGKWFLYLLAVWLVVLALRWLVNPPTNWIFASMGAVAGIGVVAVIVLVVTLIWRIGVGKHGIWGYDSWGRIRNVPWEEMASVTARNYVGAPYVVVHCPRIRFSLHFTKWMSRFDEFVAAVVAFAPAENPLRLYLSQEFGAGAPPVIGDPGANRSNES